MSEGRNVTEPVLDEIRARGGYAAKVVHASDNGTPDIAGTYRGRSLWWETKTSVGRLTRKQQHHLERAAAAGADAAVIRTRDQARQRLDAIDHHLDGKQDAA